MRLNDGSGGAGFPLVVGYFGFGQPSWTQTFEQKPEAQCHFEEKYGHVERPSVNSRAEAWENDESESTEHAGES